MQNYEEFIPTASETTAPTNKGVELISNGIRNLKNILSRTSEKVSTDINLYPEPLSRSAFESIIIANQMNPEMLTKKITKFDRQMLLTGCGMYQIEKNGPYYNFENLGEVLVEAGDDENKTKLVGHDYRMVAQKVIDGLRSEVPNMFCHKMNLLLNEYVASLPEENKPIFERVNKRYPAIHNPIQILEILDDQIKPKHRNLTKKGYLDSMGRAIKKLAK